VLHAEYSVLSALPETLCPNDLTPLVLSGFFQSGVLLRINTLDKSDESLRIGRLFLLHLLRFTAVLFKLLLVKAVLSPTRQISIPGRPVPVLTDGAMMASSGLNTFFRARNGVIFYIKS